MCENCFFFYHNVHSFRANSVDPDQTAQEQSDQGLHYLPFRLHLFDALLYGKVTLFKF